MKKIRLLLVCFGPRGKIWAKAIKKNSKTELVGICDINKDLKDKNPKNIIFFDKLDSALSYLKPDAVITVADRYETLATAVSASYLNIPLIHIQGGEISGNIDERVRHAITKLSDYHFPSTQKSKNSKSINKMDVSRSPSNRGKYFYL